MALEPQSILQRLKHVSMQPFSRQLGLLLGLAASIALAISLVQWSTTPDYAPLYAEISPADTTEIINTLETSSIQYRFDNRTGMVSVPREKIYEARLLLANQGLPKNEGAGFDMLYREQEIGISSFMEKARYDRALENELVRSIISLDNVKTARVHLAVPSQTSFIRNKNKPAASVLLNLYGGMALSDKQLAGIIHLVASSVPGLEAENVSIVDSQGKLLSSKNAHDGLEQNTEQMTYTRQIEQNYIDRIVEILTPIVGVGAVKAQVSADLDFTQVEKTSEIYSPESSLRSEQVVEELSQQNRVGGIPGTLSNQPPPETLVRDNPEDPTNNQVADRTSTRQIRNYELDKTISHIKEATGKLNKLSVAVVLDYKLQPNEEGEMIPQPLPEAQLAEITALVKEAVGFNEGRGDSVNIVNSSFVPVPEVEALPEPSLLEQEWLWRIVKYVLVALLVPLVAFMVIRPLMRIPAATPIGTNSKTPLPGQTAAEDIFGEDQVTLSGQNQIGLPPGSPSYQHQFSVARNMAETEPERVAHVVKSWMTEDA